jgi:hypothetical protein
MGDTEAKRVKVEVVDSDQPHPRTLHENRESRKQIFWLLTKLKFGVAIFLDVVDFLVCWIPIINTLWEFATFAVLIAIIRHKFLAYFSLTEVLFPGIGVSAVIDGLIPSATMIVAMDSLLTGISHRKTN